MVFLDDFKAALASGWEFFYNLPDIYPLRYKNAAGSNEMGSGSIGGEIAEYQDSEGAVLLRIDNRGLVGKLHGGIPGEIRFGGWTTSYLATNLTPYGWLACQGQTISKTTYAILYAAIGDQFAIGGEPVGDFRLPNADKKSLLGAGSNAVGTMLGAETFSIAAHTHANPTHAHTIASHTHGMDHDHFMGNHTHFFTDDHGHGGNTGTPSDHRGVTDDGTSQQSVGNLNHTHPISTATVDGDTSANGAATKTAGPTVVASGTAKTATDANSAALTTATDGSTTSGSSGAISNQNLYHPSLVVHAIIWTGQGV